jgi:HEAT repeat protein
VASHSAGDVRSQAPRLIPLLSDPDINVRNAVAIALGLLQAKQAVPELRNAYENDQAGAVKMFAAVSLKQLGDTTADSFLEGLLKGQIAEIQVIAAGAWQFATSKSPVWEKAVRTLLASPNDLHRVRAAELLAGVDPAAARNILTSAVASRIRCYAAPPRKRSKAGRNWPTGARAPADGRRG